MKLGNYDVMLLIETKSLDALYCMNRLGYGVLCSVMTSTAAGGDQGGVGLVKRERPEEWDIDSTLLHRPNVVSCKIFSGLQRTPLIRD